MADLLKMDPARIERLRDPARLETVDPEAALALKAPVGAGPVVDVGCGVGFVTLPAARRFGDRDVVGVDVLEGMLALLSETAATEGLANLKTALMPGPVTIPLDDDSASLLLMLQVHHELDDAPGLMAECRRVLAPGASIVIVDWKSEEDGAPPAKGRRLPARQIVGDLETASFRDVALHDLYPLHTVATGAAD